jgi:hypothetical protein
MMEATSLADQKLKLEIEEMRTPPWQKPSSFAVWLPLLLVVHARGGVGSTVYRDCGGIKVEFFHSRYRRHTGDGPLHT